MTRHSSTIRSSFAPIATPTARILILGSLPGEESLRRQEYYAKKQNAFWQIMGELVGAFPATPYAERLNRLRESGIALWDVCGSAERAGSMDSNIRLSTVVPNDFGAFLKKHPHIQLICFNGQPAEKLFRQKALPLLPPAYAAIRRGILPSTSPAHARMRFEEKLSVWRKILINHLASNAG